MDSSASTLLLCSPSLDNLTNKDQKGNNNNHGVFIFDSSLLEKQTRIPRQFIWPNSDLVFQSREELNEPIIDLYGFINGDEVATKHAADLIKLACLNHGFFQVVNHGIDKHLISAAHYHIEAFFNLPVNHKLKARKKPGSTWGYSGAHADRFSSKLPWKETLSFGFNDNSEDSVVLNYFLSVLGKDFEQTG